MARSLRPKTMNALAEGRAVSIPLNEPASPVAAGITMQMNGPQLNGSGASSTNGKAPEGFTRTAVAKILMVDDHPENLIALEAALTLGGRDFVIEAPLEFVRASSGEDALRKVLRDDFAVILLDVQMPGMD